VSDPTNEIWRAWGLQLGRGGEPLLNLLSILEHDPKLAGIAHYDEFLQRILRADGQEWGDADDLNLALHFQRETGLNRMGRDIVAQAVITIAHRHRTNCVRAWLEGLKHDGTARIDDFFADCFGAESSDYVKPRAATSGYRWWRASITQAARSTTWSSSRASKA
jgi:putative DNA primase/helicase